MLLFVCIVLNEIKRIGFCLNVSREHLAVTAVNIMNNKVLYKIVGLLNISGCNKEFKVKIVSRFMQIMKLL